MTNSVHSVFQETMCLIKYVIFSAANRKIIVSIFSVKPLILQWFFGWYKIIQLGSL